MTSASSIQQALPPAVGTTAAVINNNTKKEDSCYSKQIKYKNFLELQEREDFLHKLKDFHKLKG